MQNIGSVAQYTNAYYGAIGAVERGELVIKYKEPGFQGSGGFLGTTSYGPTSDKLTNGMDSITNDNNGLDRNITSRTTSIPSPGNGNVDYLLAANDSKNYNMIDYFHGGKINLSLDNTTIPNDYYIGGSPKTFFNGGFFSGEVRLPPKVVSNFGGIGINKGSLCFDNNNTNCDPDKDGLIDDPVINRFLDGTKNGTPFTIIPTIGIYEYSGKTVDPSVDIAFRKSLINPNFLIKFGSTFVSNYFSPIITNGTTLTEHNVISVQPDIIKKDPFNTILLNNTNNITGLQLSFGVVNLLRSQNNNIYPFLEYKFSFPQAIADTYYTINGHARVGEYDVNIIIKKPTQEGSAFGDFTVIF